MFCYHCPTSPAMAAAAAAAAAAATNRIEFPYCKSYIFYQIWDIFALNEIFCSYRQEDTMSYILILIQWVCRKQIKYILI